MAFSTQTWELHQRPGPQNIVGLVLNGDPHKRSPNLKKSHLLQKRQHGLGDELGINRVLLRILQGL